MHKPWWIVIIMARMPRKSDEFLAEEAYVHMYVILVHRTAFMSVKPSSQGCISAPHEQMGIIMKTMLLVYVFTVLYF